MSGEAIKPFTVEREVMGNGEPSYIAFVLGNEVARGSIGLELLVNAANRTPDPALKAKADALEEALAESQALIEVASGLADRLSVLEHTTGLDPETRNILADYDGMFLATIMQNKAALAAYRESGQ